MTRLSTPYIHLDQGDTFRGWADEHRPQFLTLDLTDESGAQQAVLFVPARRDDATTVLASLAAAVARLEEMVAAWPEDPPREEPTDDGIPF